MSNYLVFAGSTMLTDGGWRDFVGAYDEKKDAVEAAKSAAKSCSLSTRLHWWHVVDLASLRILAAHDIKQRRR